MDLFKGRFGLELDNSTELLKKLKDVASGNLGDVASRYNVPPEVLERARNTPLSQMVNERYPYQTKMRRKIYIERKKILQIELVKLQRWVRETGQKVVLVFEGRDAAGKGGTIKRFTEHLNPRRARVVALQKPSPQELGEWYFQRYIRHLPTDGEIVFFDRSWYNRAGVEKVMGFCSPEQYQLFVQHVPIFEEMLVNSGIKLIKFWFSVSREEQIRRFIARTHDPLKQWKLSPMDVASLGLWKDYTEAKESMFYYSDKDNSPWIVVRSDDKKRARLNAMKYVLGQFEYTDKSHAAIIPLDHQILGRAKDIYEPDELIQRDLFKESL